MRKASKEGQASIAEANAVDSRNEAQIPSHQASRRRKHLSLASRRKNRGVSRQGWLRREEENGTTQPCGKNHVSRPGCLLLRGIGDSSIDRQGAPSLRSSLTRVHRGRDSTGGP